MDPLGPDKTIKTIKRSRDKFICKHCDYTTPYLGNFKRHILTPKHRVLAQGPGLIAKRLERCIHKCQFCSKIFKTRSGKSKHIRKCSNNPIIVIKRSEELEKKLEEANKRIEKLEKENHKIHIKGLESIVAAKDNHIEDLKSHTGTQNINTQNNNCINIQLYLDEHCKNAMPIMDFIKELQFKLTDINPERPASTIESLSRAITDKLEDMDQEERPVHCSDAKRLVFHVKDASGWTKDVDNKKIDKAIGWANSRHQGAWIAKATEEQWMNKKHDSGYLNMNVAMGKFSDDPKRAKKKVKRAIAKAVHLKLNEPI